MIAIASYKILSPSGNFHYVKAESIYHAIQLVVEIDNYVLSNVDYFKVNGIEQKVPININTNYKLN